MLGHVKRVPYCGPTDVRFHRTKFSRHGDLATGIFAPLDNSTIKSDLHVFHVSALNSFV